jgi:hypothetical protein
MPDTQVKTEVNVESNAKCVALIARILKHEVEGESLKLQLAKLALDEGKRQGFDKEQIKTMIVLSWREARGFKSKAENEIRAFDFEQRSSVSKIMALAYPANTSAASDLEKAIAHNSKVGVKRDRIGENRLLDITRGKLTFDDAIAGKSIERAKAAKKEQKASFTAEAENVKVSPSVRFTNALNAVCDMLKDELTLDAMQDLASKVFAKRATK